MDTQQLGEKYQGGREDLCPLDKQGKNHENSELPGINVGKKPPDFFVIDINGKSKEHIFEDLDGNHQI